MLTLGKLAKRRLSKEAIVNEWRALGERRLRLQRVRTIERQPSEAEIEDAKRRWNESKHLIP